MIPAAVRIFVCKEPVDMRRSFDGLAQTAREQLGKDPQEGGLFVFHGKRKRTLKVLWLDGHGWSLLYRRLHGARFILPRHEGEVVASLSAQELAALLQGMVMERGRRRVIH